MLPKDFFKQFEAEYEIYRSQHAKGLIKFELPFDKPGYDTSLKGRKVVSFASNDYLSMLGRPEIAKAAKDAVDRYGTGAGSSMLGSGSLAIHRALSEELADFLGKESVVLFPTGYSAMMGFAAAHVMNGASVYSDAANHRSIIDGLKLGEGFLQDFSVTFVQHNALKSLESKHRKRLESQANYHLLYLEGVYSMKGDQGDLKTYLPYCKEHGLMTAIDDAHGIGVLGKNGRGTASEQQAESDVDFILGTFSKTFATTGGFVAGSKEALDYLRLLCGVYMFSASIVPANVQTARAVLEIVRKDDGPRQKLWSNIARLKKGLSQLGFDYGQSDSAIVPVYIRDTEKTLVLAHRLLESGFYVVAAIPPGVGEGEQLLRVSVNAGHTDEQIDRFLSTLEDHAKTLGQAGKEAS
ncbi:MAG TPA: aminotransferase class I/II-fold pyridoxal phosphate-dependent enzyme [bacterium]|nr:aminotransferase class I/II-fold pyridoxal phosphate-dependent enzyme [bacterium]